MKTIGEIVKIYKGNKAENVFEDKRLNAIPYLQIEDLRPNSKKKYTDDLNGFVVNEKDVLIAWDGANAGTVSFGLNGFIGSTLAALRLKNNDYNTAFIGRFLQSKFNFLRENCTGATIPHINRNTLENLSLEIPNLDEQKRIAAILDKADRLRRQRRFAQTLSDSFLQSVFIKMFGDPVSNPMNWQLKNFGDVVINKDSQRQPVKSIDRAERKGIYPYYGASGIIDYVNDYLFDGRNLLISEDGMNLIFRSTPIAFIAEGKYWVNNHAHVVSENGQVDLEFLRVLLNNADLDDFITGIDQKKLTQDNLNKIPIPVPPIPLQEKFAEIVQKFERVRRQQREATRHATHLFQTLLHRAFRGEL